MYQPTPPRPADANLPTMYDLKSEDPEELGLPDEFHELQPRLLRETFCPPTCPPDQILVGTDLNLYYDVRHTQWYKRPDWFAVLGVGRSQAQQELRLSYVIWQEGVTPAIVIELLSPGTEDEDLGKTLQDVAKPPTKWNVYERVLRIPYYVVFSRYTQELRVFELKEGLYQALSAPQPRFWLSQIALGLGVWEGDYDGVLGRWLRWYDADGLWLPTLAEKAAQAQIRLEQTETQLEQAATQLEQTATQLEQAETQLEQTETQLEQTEAQLEQTETQLEQERRRSQQLAERLRALGIDPD